VEEEGRRDGRRGGARLKQLEDENATLKRLVADLSLDKATLQDVLRKKFSLPASAAGWSGTRGMPIGLRSVGHAASFALRARRFVTSQ
jgi:hypothetical protein